MEAVCMARQAVIGPCAKGCQMEAAAREMEKDHGAAFARQWKEQNCSAGSCERKAMEQHPRAAEVLYYGETLSRLKDFPALAAPILSEWTTEELNNLSMVKRVLATDPDGRRNS